MNNSKHQASVLIVDDERTIADTFALILKKRGFHTRTAYSGESAVAECLSAQPDIVISDIMTGALNGIAAAIAIRQQAPACRIILMSGSGATDDFQEEARRHGHEFEILAKPVHPTELLLKIHGILGG